MKNLKELLLNADGGYIPLTRKLTHKLGIKAAGFICELCDKYEYYKANNLLNESGEFYYTIADMEIATALTKKEQSKIIENLKCFNLFKTVNRCMPGTFKKVRYFKLDVEIDKKLENIISSAKDKINTIERKNNKEVKRCNELVTMEVTKSNLPKLPKVTTGSDKRLLTEVTKSDVNKNREQEQNIKTDKQEQTVCLPDSIKDKEYNKLIDKLIKIFPDKTEKEISDRINQINKNKYNYKDINSGYDYIEEIGRIEFFLEKPDKNEQFNKITSSIIKGVPDALEQEKEEKAEYEEMNNRTFNSLPENNKLITKNEENVSITPEDKKQLDFLKDLNNNHDYIGLFKANEQAQDVYKKVLKPFEKDNVLIGGFTRTDMINFERAYKALQELAS